MIALLALLAQSGIDWRSDYDAARAEAREKDRRVVLHFFMTGRPICKAMDEETFGQATTTPMRSTIIFMRSG